MICNTLKSMNFVRTYDHGTTHKEITQFRAYKYIMMSLAQKHYTVIVILYPMLSCTTKFVVYLHGSPIHPCVYSTCLVSIAWIKSKNGGIPNYKTYLSCNAWRRIILLVTHFCLSSTLHFTILPNTPKIYSSPSEFTEVQLENKYISFSLFISPIIIFYLKIFHH